MRIRALLFIPALAAAALAVGVSSASAATLFTTNAHTTRVTIGATTTATSEGNVDLTDALGNVSNRCTHIGLNLRLIENTEHRTSLDVYSSNIADNACHPRTVTTTHTPPWRLTITGAGTTVGGSTAFAATLHNVQFDFTGVPGVFTGNLENLSVTQSSATTNGICIDANNAGSVSNPTVGLTGSIDARFCLTTHPASTWSLT